MIKVSMLDILVASPQQSKTADSRLWLCDCLGPSRIRTDRNKTILRVVHCSDQYKHSHHKLIAASHNRKCHCLNTYKQHCVNTVSFHWHVPGTFINSFLIRFCFLLVWTFVELQKWKDLLLLSSIFVSKWRVFEAIWGCHFLWFFLWHLRD